VRCYINRNEVAVHKANSITKSHFQSSKLQQDGGRGLIHELCFEGDGVKLPQTLTAQGIEEAVKALLTAISSNSREATCMLVVASTNIMDHVRPVLRPTHPHPFNEYMAQYYVSPEVQKQLLDGTLLSGLKLHEEYKSIDLNAEHAEEVAAAQIYSAGDSTVVKSLRSKLAHMPGVGMVHTPSGKLVAFECCDGLGFNTTLYCKHEHRRKSIGSLVEMQLCERICREWVD